MAVADMPVKISFTIAVWLELFFYGIYVTLLGSGFSVLMKETTRRASRTSAFVYIWTTVAMFVVATLHIGVTLYRFMRAYILIVDPLGGDSYVLDFTRADAFLDSSLFCVMTWLGDALVIYRCYYVWNRKAWIIVIPTLILIASIVLNIVILVWDAHGPDSPIAPGPRFRFLTLPKGIVNSIFPLWVIQNIMTTGLIVLKIWKQHQKSAAHGIVDKSSSLSLIRIMRIIIESAMIYTLQSIILMILHFMTNSAQFILQHVIVPSVGIVFIVMSVRVHIARSNASVKSSGFNTFSQDGEDSVMAFNRGRSLPPGVVSLSISQDNTEIDDSISKSFSNTSYNLQTLKSKSTA